MSSPFKNGISYFTKKKKKREEKENPSIATPESVVAPQLPILRGIYTLQRPSPHSRNPSIVFITKGTFFFVPGLYQTEKRERERAEHVDATHWGLWGWHPEIQQIPLPEAWCRRGFL